MMIAPGGADQLIHDWPADLRGVEVPVIQAAISAARATDQSVERYGHV
jgi:hypothetical protein